MVGAVDVRPRAKLRLFVVVLAFVDVKTRRCHRSTRPSCKTFHTPSKAIRLLIFSNHLPRFMGYCKTSFLHILTYVHTSNMLFRGQSMNTYRHQKHKTLFFPPHISHCQFSGFSFIPFPVIFLVKNCATQIFL